MLLCRTQADGANCVVVRAVGENQHMQAIADQPYGNETDLSIIEAVILAFKSRVPIEPFRSLQGHTMFGDIAFVFGWVELDLHDNFVHPKNWPHNDFRTPKKIAPACRITFASTRGLSIYIVRNISVSNLNGVETMSTLYSTSVTAVGGRAGTIKSDDGLLDLKLALPKALGGKGDATNPEQLFAAGYAACFENAVIHVTRNASDKVKDDDIVVVGTVGMGPNGAGGFALTVALDVTISGIEQSVAEEIVAKAHAVCPYSNAVKGNIDVAITVTVN